MSIGFPAVADEAISGQIILDPQTTLDGSILYWASADQLKDVTQDADEDYPEVFDHPELH